MNIYTICYGAFQIIIYNVKFFKIFSLDSYLFQEQRTVKIPLRTFQLLRRPYPIRTVLSHNQLENRLDNQWECKDLLASQWE